MEINSTKSLISKLNFLDLYTQTKQRIDLDVDISVKKLKGKTKLTFRLKNDYQEILNKIELNAVENLILKVNAENMFIDKIYTYSVVENEDGSYNNSNDTYSNINKPYNPMENYKNPDKENNPKIFTENLENFLHLNPENFKFCLKKLYENIEDMDSFKNLNRIEWESRQEGNLEILMDGKKFLQEMKNKIKIIIEYEIDDKSIGVVFQNFFDEKMDMEYEICYTPNFYFNTCNWVPCIYQLRSQIHWRVYFIVSQDYSVYCSCQITCVYQDIINNKRAFFYKSKEPLNAKCLGFIVVYDKIFNRVEDPNNKNILYIINENKRERLEKSLISNGLMNAAYSFYDEFFESDMNMNMNTLIIFIPYLIINTFSGKYSKFLSVKDENYFNLIKFPNLYILPEKLIYNDTIPDIMEHQLKSIGKLFATNYIGGLISESNYADFWLVCGIENWLSDNFLTKCFGQNHLKNRLYKYVNEFKKYSKHGKEKRPLYTNSFSHPAELQIDPLVYLKSSIVLHLLEAQVEKAFLQKALRNIINERLKNGYNISTEGFIKIFKKNCGVNLKHFMHLWIYKTGMLELNINYNYNKRTNSIDLEIFQKPIAQDYYENNPFFKLKDVNYEQLEKLDKKLAVVDFKIRPVRYFDVNLNILIYQTNGIEIMRENHMVKLESEKDSMFQNFPLSAKIRKAPIKKREQEFIQELITNTSIGKIYSNEEIEKILTQNSIMWVRADSDITHIRQVHIPQQHILYEYIKLFKEGDVVGQYESLKNISKINKTSQTESLSQTLIILETFIRSPAYYKLRLNALKLYVKILLKMKYEEGYMFLLDYLEDSYAEILKNKTQLNRDTYFVLKKIIKYLGNYREDYFNEFFVIGRVTNSSIQNKIIDKFLAILISNDLNLINGFNDSYIMREILLGCSKLNLQEKTFFLLKKIVKILRIEKLKRSFNEIIIISAIDAFLTVLIKNEFFSSTFSAYGTRHMFQNYSGVKAIVNEIMSEINYYINSDCENYELKIILDYFQIYLVFYKSKNFLDFIKNVLPLIFNLEEKMQVEGDLSDFKSFTGSTGSSAVLFSENENFFSRIMALDLLIEQTEFTFENLNEKIEMINLIKEILFCKTSYLRIDVRTLAEKLFVKILNKPIISGEKSANGTIHVNSHHFLHNLNKNSLNFFGKKYADEEWLYSFAREERRENEYQSGEGYGKVPMSELSSETQSRYGTKQVSLIKKYQMKYPNDTYAIFNYNLDLEKKQWLECSYLILEKLINHPLAMPFCIPLNQEVLGELYEQYHMMIKHPMDFSTIKEKLNAGEYQNMNEFNRDILLIFSNCRDFNVKGSDLHESANQLEDFFKILMEPIRKKNLETLSRNEFPEIKIKLQGEELIS